MTELKSIWHTADETPKPWVNIAFYVDGYLYDGYYELDYNQYGIFGADKVEKWCYIKELSSYIPALENENKDLSDKIGKLETELDRTRKALDVARSGLIDIFNYEGVPEYVVKHVRQVLDQSKNETALEQKDGK